MSTTHRKTGNRVYTVNYHLVFCPKYRRKCLVGPVKERVDALIRQKVTDLGGETVALEVMPDHVHLFVAMTPTNAPQFYANQFKGYTSRVLREEFPHLKSALPSLWSRSYYVGSAGMVTEATIRRYIASQWERR